MLEKILQSRATTVVLLALAAVFAIHLIVQNTEGLRLDMTSDNLYALSDGTREILERMHTEGVQPVELKLYFSSTVGKTLPKFIKDFITYERYLRALLRELETASNGKLQVQFIDPKPDSDEAQDAADYGLDGKQVNQNGDLFYFGLAFETQTGSKDKIEFLWPNQQETVEYEIARRLQSLLWPAKKRVGVLSSLEVLSDASNPYLAQILAAQGRQPRDSWIAMQLLQQTYEVSKIEPDVDTISAADYDLVVVIHPKDLSPTVQQALDGWVVRGGNTLVFVDPYSLDDQPPQNPQQPWMAYQYKPASNLPALLGAWGLTRVEDRVAADFDLGVTRSVRRLGPAERVIVDLGIDGENAAETLDTASPILRGLDDLRFFLAGNLERVGEGVSGVTYTPLIKTTAKGSTLAMSAGFPGGSEELVFADVATPAKLLDHFSAGSQPVVLAYELRGKLPAAFPEENTVPEPERQDATVVVFADVDFISDQVAFQSTPIGALAANDNHKVLLNAVDYLLGSEALMKVRAKKALQRPFTLFDAIEASADRDSLERERQLRAEIEGFQTELNQKQSGLGQQNAALFQKQVQDEVDRLNEKIEAANRELREIRKKKRAALEGEESRVRFTTLWLMPSLVMVLGLGLWFQRKNRDAKARRTS
ncbi:MAG: hypothetical protein HC897_09790 [Thermoanaerobaculia bacterium]|nr:hypothetical protein [Thermoanaerobaculia bacterium]